MGKERLVNGNLGLTCEHFPVSRPPQVTPGQVYMLPQYHFARLLVSAASCAVLALGLCGCQTDATPDITGALGDKTEASRAAEPRQALESYRDRFRANPKDPDAALQYAKALRGAGQRSQAVAVLEQASMAHPGDKAVLAGYGRALADNGNFQQAFDILNRAHSPEDPDWRILSAQGAVLDQLGRYDEAREYYTSALKIAPDDPSVLSNLGLSYMLEKNLPKAEEILRQANSHANADPRVRLNLALVIGLRGRVAEAESLAKADRPPDEAAANVAYLRRLLSRNADAHADTGNRPPAISPVAAVARPD
jgi:Flp pilus assembly protein TadD